MRERVQFDIPAVHVESNHITSKQCHCQSLTFYPRNESPHMVHRQHADVWSGFVVGIQRWYRLRRKQGESHTTYRCITERRKCTPKSKHVADKMAGDISNDE